MDLKQERYQLYFNTSHNNHLRLKPIIFLKKGGKAVLQVPISKNTFETVEDFSITDPKQREHVFGQFDHVRIYGQDYLQRLEESGFKVHRINISSEFMKFGLNKDEDIFVCEK